MGILPDDLGEVEVFTTGRGRGVGLAVEAGFEEVDLAVVPLFGDADSAGIVLLTVHVTSRAVGGNVLTIVTTSLVHIMGEDAGISSVESPLSKFAVPGNIRRRVVATMNVVLVYDGGCVR